MPRALNGLVTCIIILRSLHSIIKTSENDWLATRTHTTFYSLSNPLEPCKFFTELEWLTNQITVFLLLET